MKAALKDLIDFNPDFFGANLAGSNLAEVLGQKTIERRPCNHSITPGLPSVLLQVQVYVRRKSDQWNGSQYSVSFYLDDELQRQALGGIQVHDNLNRLFSAGQFQRLGSGLGIKRFYACLMGRLIDLASKKEIIEQY